MPATPKLFNLANIDNALVTVYTCPASTFSFVHNLILCNVGAVAITVNCTVRDVSAGITTFLVKAASIPVGGSLIVLGDNNKLALEETDFIQCGADSGTNVLDVTGSVLEQS